VIAGRNLRRHSQAEREEAHESAWPLWASLVALAIATAFTAVISEILVHSLEAFAHAIGATEFFIAAIVVAVVGNAAEHGGAVVIARDGKMKLASEIAISSSAQVALLVTPIVMLLSLLFSHHLSLTFRWEETVAMAAAVGLAAITVADGRSRRWEGGLLVAAFLAVAVWFWFA
jgi:Ca2+:H+ antiporter